MDTTEGRINELKGMPTEMIYPEPRGEIRVKTCNRAPEVYGAMLKGLTCMELKA